MGGHQLSKKTSIRGKKLLAIDFGSHSIKFVSGKVTNGVITLYKVLSIPIPPDIYNNGEVQNTKELGALILNTIIENGLKHLPVICTASGPNCVLRVLNLPIVKESELMEMIQYEIQQYLPVDSAQYIIQYAKLDGLKSTVDGNETLIVGAIPRNFAEAIYRTFETINIEPFALDIHVHAFSKLVETYKKQPLKTNLRTESVIFVDLGHSQMDISLYEDGYFFMDRRIPSCGLLLDQKISRVFDMSVQDARLEKQQAPDICVNSEEYSSEHRILNVVQSAVDEWIADVSRVVKFYGSRSSGKTITQIYLYGGSSKIKGIAHYFEKALDIPTHCMTTCDCAVFAVPNTENVAIYFNAFGAMIRKEV